MASTKSASSGDKRSVGDMPSKRGPAGSRPAEMETAGWGEETDVPVYPELLLPFREPESSISFAGSGVPTGGESKGAVGPQSPPPAFCASTTDMTQAHQPSPAQPDLFEGPHGASWLPVLQHFHPGLCTQTLELHRLEFLPVQPFPSLPRPSAPPLSLVALSLPRCQKRSAWCRICWWPGRRWRTGFLEGSPRCPRGSVSSLRRMTCVDICSRRKIRRRRQTNPQPG